MPQLRHDSVGQVRKRGEARWRGFAVQFELEFYSLDLNDTRDLLERKLVDLASVEKAETLALGIAKYALMKGKRANLYIIRDATSSIISEVRLPIIDVSDEHRSVNATEDAAKVSRILSGEGYYPPGNNDIDYSVKVVRTKANQSLVKKRSLTQQRAEKAKEAAKKILLLRKTHSHIQIED